MITMMFSILFVAISSAIISPLLEECVVGAPADEYGCLCEGKICQVGQYCSPIDASVGSAFDCTFNFDFEADESVGSERRKSETVCSPLEQCCEDCVCGAENCTSSTAWCFDTGCVNSPPDCPDDGSDISQPCVCRGTDDGSTTDDIGCIVGKYCHSNEYTTGVATCEDDPPMIIQCSSYSHCPGGECGGEVYCSNAEDWCFVGPAECVNNPPDCPVGSFGPDTTTEKCVCRSSNTGSTYDDMACEVGKYCHPNDATTGYATCEDDPIQIPFCSSWSPCSSGNCDGVTCSTAGDWCYLDPAECVNNPPDCPVVEVLTEDCICRSSDTGATYDDLACRPGKYCHPNPGSGFATCEDYPYSPVLCSSWSVCPAGAECGPGAICTTNDDWCFRNPDECVTSPPDCPVGPLTTEDCICRSTNAGSTNDDLACRSGKYCHPNPGGYATCEDYPYSSVVCSSWSPCSEGDCGGETPQVYCTTDGDWCYLDPAECVNSPPDCPVGPLTTEDCICRSDNAGSTNDDLACRSGKYCHPNYGGYASCEDYPFSGPICSSWSICPTGAECGPGAICTTDDDWCYRNPDECVTNPPDCPVGPLTTEDCICRSTNAGSTNDDLACRSGKYCHPNPGSGFATCEDYPYSTVVCSSWSPCPESAECGPGAICTTNDDWCFRNPDECVTSPPDCPVGPLTTEDCICRSDNAGSTNDDLACRSGKYCHPNPGGYAGCEDYPIQYPLCSSWSPCPTDTQCAPGVICTTNDDWCYRNPDECVTSPPDCPVGSLTTEDCVCRSDNAGSTNDDLACRSGMYCHPNPGGYATCEDYPYSTVVCSSWSPCSGGDCAGVVCYTTGDWCYLDPPECVNSPPDCPVGPPTTEDCICRASAFDLACRSGKYCHPNHGSGNAGCEDYPYSTAVCSSWSRCTTGGECAGVYCSSNADWCYLDPPECITNPPDCPGYSLVTEDCICRGGNSGSENDDLACRPGKFCFPNLGTTGMATCEDTNVVCSSYQYCSSGKCGSVTCQNTGDWCHIGPDQCVNDPPYCPVGSPATEICLCRSSDPGSTDDDRLCSVSEYCNPNIVIGYAECSASAPPIGYCYFNEFCAGTDMHCGTARCNDEWCFVDSVDPDECIADPPDCLVGIDAAQRCVCRGDLEDLGCNVNEFCVTEGNARCLDTRPECELWGYCATEGFCGANDNDPYCSSGDWCFANPLECVTSPPACPFGIPSVEKCVCGGVGCDVSKFCVEGACEDSFPQCEVNSLCGVGQCGDVICSDPLDWCLNITGIYECDLSSSLPVCSSPSHEVLCNCHDEIGCLFGEYCISGTPSSCAEQPEVLTICTNYTSCEGGVCASNVNCLAPGDWCFPEPSECLNNPQDCDEEFTPLSQRCKCNDLYGCDIDEICHPLQLSSRELACQTCDLTCMNGGEIDYETCSCNCSVNVCQNGGELNEDCSKCRPCDLNWIGDLCQTCSLPCDKGDHDEKCEECVCDPHLGSWSGDFCDECELECDHGDLNEEHCFCQCEGNWIGSSCGVCDLDCAVGDLNTEECECEVCSLGCVHGVADEDCKRCICDPHAGSWGGELCSKCELECENKGKLNKDHCFCDCEGNFVGSSCKICEIECPNGKLNSEDCICEECTGSFLGPDCSICGLECLHNGVPNPSCEKCQKCDKGWEGLECEIEIIPDSAVFQETAVSTTIALMFFAGLGVGIFVVCVLLGGLFICYTRKLKGKPPDDLSEIELIDVSTPEPEEKEEASKGVTGKSETNPAPQLLDEEASPEKEQTKEQPETKKPDGQVEKEEKEQLETKKPDEKVEKEEEVDSSKDEEKESEPK